MFFAVFYRPQKKDKVIFSQVSVCPGGVFCMISLPVRLPGPMYLVPCSFQRVSLQEGGLCLGGLCERGLCERGGGICQGCLCEGGLCEWESVNGGVSVKGGLYEGSLRKVGLFVRGVSVKENRVSSPLIGPLKQAVRIPLGCIPV